MTEEAEDDMPDEEFDDTISVQPIEIEEHTIEDSELEYIEKKAETVYHWFYPKSISQNRAYKIAEETFGIANPEVYKEDMFDSITVILDYVDNKGYKERHESLIKRC